jgi:hypothetical protein
MTENLEQCIEVARKMGLDERRVWLLAELLCRYKTTHGLSEQTMFRELAKEYDEKISKRTRALFEGMMRSTREKSRGTWKTLKGRL